MKRKEKQQTNLKLTLALARERAKLLILLLLLPVNGKWLLKILNPDQIFCRFANAPICQIFVNLGK